MVESYKVDISKVDGSRVSNSRVGRSTWVFLFALVVAWAATGWAAAQAEPVTVTLEAFVVTTVTQDDGTVTETFTAAAEARPGQVVEYRVLVRNDGAETLPAGAVVVAGPVPATTAYLADTASGGDLVTTEFSAELAADGSPVFMAAPVMMTVTNEAGEQKRVVANPDQYTGVRWTLQEALPPGAQHNLVYRVEVL